MQVRGTHVTCVLTFCWYNMTFSSRNEVSMRESLTCIGMKHDRVMMASTVYIVLVGLTFCIYIYAHVDYPPNPAF